MKSVQRCFQKKPSKRLLKTVFFCCAFMIAVFEVLIVHILHWGHAYFWFDELPAFSSIFGFLSSVIIIVIAKFILAPIVSRKETYYD